MGVSAAVGAVADAGAADAAIGAGADAAFGAAATGAAADAAAGAGIDAAVGGGAVGLADAAGAATAGSGLAGLSNILGPASSIAKGAAGLAQAAGIGSSTNRAAQAADPFASQRPQYQAQLAALMNGDQSALLSDPAFQTGMTAVQRSSAALGQLGSGNLATALLDYGGNIFNQQAQLLSVLSGATTGSPASAGNAITQGSANQAQLVGQGLSGIQSGLGSLSARSNSTGQPDLNPSDPINNVGSGGDAFSGIDQAFGPATGSFE